MLHFLLSRNLFTAMRVVNKATGAEEACYYTNVNLKQCLKRKGLGVGFFFSVSLVDCKQSAVYSLLLHLKHGNLCTGGSYKAENPAISDVSTYIEHPKNSSKRERKPPRPCPCAYWTSVRPGWGDPRYCWHPELHSQHWLCVAQGGQEDVGWLYSL